MTYLTDRLFSGLWDSSCGILLWRDTTTTITTDMAASSNTCTGGPPGFSHPLDGLSPSNIHSYSSTHELKLELETQPISKEPRSTGEDNHHGQTAGKTPGAKCQSTGWATI